MCEVTKQQDRGGRCISLKLAICFSFSGISDKNTMCIMLNIIVTNTSFTADAALCRNPVLPSCSIGSLAIV